MTTETITNKSSIRPFSVIQREWLDAIGKFTGDQVLTVNQIIELGVLGNQLLLEMNLTGVREGLSHGSIR